MFLGNIRKNIQVNMETLRNTSPFQAWKVLYNLYHDNSNIQAEHILDMSHVQE
jgi:hypothetical protein